jgi:hypothetical protein
MTRAPYRRHALQFKLQVCQQIRSGQISRREAQRKYVLSAKSSLAAAQARHTVEPSRD